MGKARTFIHLSDIHFKKGTAETGYDLDQDIRNEITNDIKRLSDTIENFDGVLVTGDIAFSGKKEEYQVAEKWLAEITELIGCKPEEVWVVPGNHDVDRSIETGAVKALRDTLRNAPEVDADHQCKELLHDDKENAGQLIFKPLAAYCEFAAKYKCLSLPEKPQWVWSFELNDGSELRLVGLNSAILSHGQDDTGANKLLLNSHQTISLQNEHGVEYMVMCHHPLDWLKNRDAVEEKLNNRARIQLYGHKHTQVHRVINNETIYLVSGATHPSRTENNWLPRYNAITVLIETNKNTERDMQIKIYPRVWHQNTQKFIADKNNCDESYDFKAVLFRLDKWQNPTKPIQEKTTNVNSEPPEIITDEDGEANINIRKLTYEYLNLPYSKQMRIATELELLYEGDDGLEKAKLFKSVLERARDKNLLGLLQEKVSGKEKE